MGPKQKLKIYLSSRRISRRYPLTLGWAYLNIPMSPKKNVFIRETRPAWKLRYALIRTHLAIHGLNMQLATIFPEFGKELLSSVYTGGKGSFQENEVFGKRNESFFGFHSRKLWLLALTEKVPCYA